MNDLTHIDLFSGIGGFSLAAQWAGFRTICCVEIDPFCQEVLKARFGAVADTVGGHRGKIPQSDQWDISRCFSGSHVLIPDIRDFDGCDIQAATMAWKVGDPDYSREWVYDPDGLPTCTAFKVET